MQGPSKAVQTYSVEFEGKKILVDAIVGPEPRRVRVCNLRDPSATTEAERRDGKTYRGEMQSGADGHDYSIALGAWSPERREALYEAVRVAAERRK